MLKLWLFGSLLASLPVNAPPTKRQAEILRWVDHYSARMGVVPDGVVFGRLPGNWCGVTGRATQWEGVFIGFDTDKRLCRIWPARQQALHELCHVKLDHTHSAESNRKKHRAVDECMKRWR